MAAPFYSWHVGTLVDGRLTAEIPLISTSWSLVMDDAGAVSGTLPLADPDVAKLNPYLIAEPCRCFLAVSYTDENGTETFLEAGPIWTHAYDSSSKQLTIGGAGVWSYYDHRKVLKVLAAGVNPATDVNTYSNLSLGTIAKRLVQLANMHTAGALPIVLPDDEASVNTRTYLGYEMNGVGDALRNLTKDQNGPEIQFVPRRRSDDPRYLEWVMRAGTAEAPLLSQAGADWVWDMTVAQSSVGGVTVNRDGTTVADRWWVQGAGTDVSTMFARAESSTLSDAGFPLLESADTGHAGEDGAKLQATIDAYAQADLIGSQGPLETWTLAVQRDEPPVVGSYRPGDYVSVTVGDDEPYIPAGTYRTRMTGISGDDTNAVSIQLAPTIGGF